MPTNIDKLMDAAHDCGKPKQPKRTNRTDHAEQADNLNRESRAALSALAQAGVNGINAQVFALDSRLSQFERDTAIALADRLRESPLRIYALLVQELQSEPVAAPSLEALFDDIFEVPYLALPEISAPFAGQLPG